ncbi:Aste57867_24750 [Aphanomyces stellatus]|uniref:Aste57867_24750 protein n=1 Tax=Aphanomyces stellatus TaxID=120398 RepID=A0A485LRC6_9STRA|nr:hypothetical protein As57867_024672 [Aphanomyces stellatus]VFU01386.1 Aste57867_24750 [Aphanomyces stellatus]
MSSTVLTSPDLLRIIFVSQHGLSEDLLPFRPFLRRSLDTDAPFDTVQLSLRAFGRVFAPWFDAHDGQLDLLPHAAMSWALSYATFTGDLLLLQSCSHLPLPRAVVDVAAACNHLHIVEALCAAPASVRAMDWAAQENHVSMLRFLRRHRREGCSNRAAAWAAARGHFVALRFLVSENLATNASDALTWAAMHGHLECVGLLNDVGFDCTTVAMDMAAHNGHLEVVQFLHMHRREGCTTNAMDFAAKHGHLEVVQFLHAHRREGCTTAALYDAQARGHSEVVQFLTARYPALVAPPVALAPQCHHWTLSVS